MRKGHKLCKLLYTTILHSTKRCGYRMVIKLDKDHLAVEQNNHATKIAKAYIIYDLDSWPNNPLNKSQLKNYLFSATNIVINSNK